MSNQPRRSNTLTRTRGQSMAKKRSEKAPQVDLMDLFVPITARTKKQKDAIMAFNHGLNLLLTGYPGTGKTFLALGTALEMLKRRDQKFKKIVIVRSAVATRDMGFLPGKLAEKMEEFEKPYMDICSQLFNCTERTLQPYRQLTNNGLLTLLSTSYVRGITIDNAIIIIDEFQNMSEHELHSLLSRVGENCKLIISGDIAQSDLNQQKSGFARLVRTLDSMQCFSHVDFGIDDIVRSEFAKQFIINWTMSDQVKFNDTTTEKIQTQSSQNPVKITTD